MITLKAFTFGPFQENTYVLSDETGECILIDPGCFDRRESSELAGYISEKKLKPVLLLNTHGHIDHVAGNKFVHDTYGLLPQIHKEDLNVLRSLPAVAQLYNLNAEASPEPEHYISEGDKIRFGHSVLDVLFTPGHSPGSVCFVNAGQKLVIGGDVLFYESIGRSDLPGGNHATLINSITEKLMVLPDGFKVYSGHGPVTSIGHERVNNPFLN